MKNTTSTKIASFCKRVSFCLVASVITFAVWKLFLGERLFRPMIQRVDYRNLYAMVYFPVLYCLLFVASNAIRRRGIFVVAAMAVTFGYIASGVTFELFTVWDCIRNPYFPCRLYISVFSLLYFVIIPLIQMSYFIALTAVMLLRLAWKINDKMASRSS